MEIKAVLMSWKNGSCIILDNADLVSLVAHYGPPEFIKVIASEADAEDIEAAFYRDHYHPDWEAAETAKNRLEGLPPAEAVCKVVFSDETKLYCRVCDKELVLAQRRT